MKTTKRVLSLALVMVMLFALLPLSVLAETIEYTDVDYSTEITVGEVTAYSVLETDPYISPDWWGYAKGFTVELEADKEYTFALAGQNLHGDYYIDHAFQLMPETLSGDIFADELVYESESAYIGYISMLTTFTVEASGKYKILLWGFVCDENEVDIFGEETNIFSFTIEESSKIVPFAVDIETAEDMLDLQSNGTIGLYSNIELNICADIDMSDVEWIPKFSRNVVINGNNHFIKGLKAPLFNTLSTIEIYDLGIEVDIDFDNPDRNYEYKAPICGYVENAKISNCHTIGTMDINANYLESVSGFIGDVDYAEIENSSSDVDITINASEKATYLGGFITYVGGEATFKNCHYSGDITINDNDGESYIIGGFAGTLYFSRLENCSAKGKVLLLNESENPDGIEIGGFIGYTCSSEFINCRFDGDVIAPVYDNVGGFAGEGSSGNIFKNCYSAGNVEGREKVGGFVGDTNNDNVFVNIYTTANVKGNNSVGGFAGYDHVNEYQNCYASGSVTTDNTEATNVAGFIGSVDTSLFENCYAPDGDLSLVKDDTGADVDDEGISAIDFADENAVSDAVDAFNAFVEDAVDPELLNWVTVPESTPTFGFPEIEEPAKPCYHTYDGIFDDWNDDEHWELCENPDCTYSEEPYNSANHKLETVSDTADCENDGILTRKCKDCDYVVETDSYAKGHTDENGDKVCDICEHAEYILGDVDNDGDIDADDYITLKRIYFGTAKLENLDTPETAFVRSDVNRDENLDADDYITLKRAYFGNYVI